MMDEKLEADRVLSDGEDSTRSYLENGDWTPDSGDSLIVQFKTPVYVDKLTIIGSKVNSFNIFIRKQGQEVMEPYKVDGVQVRNCKVTVS